jgi:probable O-glycosylation ligase (exosortase A-associated)
MLRTIFVLGLIAVGGVYAAQSAFGGLLFYLWLAYFRPESWVWSVGFIQSLNLSLICGIYLVARTPLAGADLSVTFRRGLLLLFLLLTVLSTYMSQFVTFNSGYFQDFVKALIVTYLLSALVNDPKKLRLVLIVIVVSLGFESAKQGWVTLLIAPGRPNDNTVAVLGDNNETAVGLLMITPVLFALANTTTIQWEKRLHQFLGIGILYRAISTYSRGGFLSAGTMFILYVARSKHKLRSLVLAAVIGGALLSVLPDAFWNRMSTVQVTLDQDELDSSAASRLHFWQVAMAMANDHPLLGVGHFGFQPAYNLYDFSLGLYGRNRAVHSSWFGILAELGYPAFFLLLILLATSFLSCEKIARRALRGEIPPEFRNYALAIQTGLAVFCVGGSFLSFHYREIVWHFFGISIAMQSIADAIAAKGPVVVPTEVRPALPAAQPAWAAALQARRANRA